MTAAGGHRVVLDAVPGEVRAALIDAAGEVVEFRVERADRPSLVDAVFLGRVAAVNRGLDAAFVDIGVGRDGFLGLADARPEGMQGGGDTIAAHAGEGDAVLVQVTRDAIAEKGPRLTRRLSFAAPALVYLPGGRGAVLSKRIDDKMARQRLHDWAEATLGPAEGAVIRTQAAAAGTDELDTALATLRRRWREIEAAAAEARAPIRLTPAPSDAVQTVLDWAGEGISGIDVADGDAARALAEALAPAAPDLAGLVAAAPEGLGLFEARGLQEALEAALDPVVPLPSGGRLILEETAALVACDVDTGGAGGGRAALETNLEAAAALARELRRRELAGLVIVDFAPLKRADDRARLAARVRESVAADPATCHVAGFTRFGAFEMTRRRRRPSLPEVLTGGRRVPAKSPESVAFEAVRRVPSAATGAKGRPLAVHAHPDVLAAYDGPAREALAWLARHLGLELGRVAEPTWPRDVFEVRATEGRR